MTNAMNVEFWDRSKNLLLETHELERNTPYGPADRTAAQRHFEGFGVAFVASTYDVKPHHLAVVVSINNA